MIFQTKEAMQTTAASTGLVVGAGAITELAGVCTTGIGKLLRQDTVVEAGQSLTKLVPEKLLLTSITIPFLFNLAAAESKAAQGANRDIHKPLLFIEQLATIASPFIITEGIKHLDTIITAIKTGDLLPLALPTLALTGALIANALALKTNLDNVQTHKPSKSRRNSRHQATAASTNGENFGTRQLAALSRGDGELDPIVWAQPRAVTRAVAAEVATEMHLAETAATAAEGAQRARRLASTKNLVNLRRQQLDEFIEETDDAFLLKQGTNALKNGHLTLDNLSNQEKNFWK